MLTRPPPACPTAARWRDLLDGQADWPELAALESHLRDCPACLGLLSGLSDSEGNPAPVRSPLTGMGSEALAILAGIARNAEAVPIAGTADLPRRSFPAIPGLSDPVEIARGGMGLVYSATQRDLGRRVAVKILSSGAGLDDSSRARVLREARVLAQLRHPNVVTIYDSGEVDGSPYLVMELVEGGTLQQRLDCGVLGFREAADTVRQLALAVAEAHSLGIIHRDLKPSNVLLAGPEGSAVPKLADFGLARSVDDRLTLTGQVVGTPSYMSPEQTGLDSTIGEVGPASDVHGLGAILHALLTGRPPYRGDSTWEILARSARGRPDSTRSLRPDVPRDLETIVEKCLSREPGHRYHSAVELAEDLGRYLDGRPVSARPISPVTRAAKWARRRPALATAALLGVLLAVGGVTGVSYHAFRLGVAFEQLKAEQGRTTTALDVANRARDRSRRALESLTDDAVRGMLDRGSILNEKDLAFLRKIRGYFEEPDRDGGIEAVESLRFRASGLVRIGLFYQRIGRLDDCKAAMESAIAIHNEILGRHPGDPSAIDNRVEAKVQLAVCLGTGPGKAEALELARSAVNEFRPFVGESIARRQLLSKYLERLASRLVESGRSEEADRVYDEALAIARGLRGTKADDFALRGWELLTLFNRGLNLKNLGQLDRAEGCFSALLALAEATWKENPEHERGVNWMINALGRLVEIQLARDRPEDALPIHLRQVGLVRDRAAHVNNLITAMQKLQSAQSSLEILKRLGRIDEAVSEVREAVEFAMKRVAANPAYFDFYAFLLPRLQQMADLLVGSGRSAEAGELYDRMVELATPWEKSEAHRETIIPWLANSLAASAKIDSATGRAAEAVRRIERAIQISNEPYRPRLTLDMARYLRVAGDFEGARAAARMAASSPTLAEEARTLLTQIEAEKLETARRP